MKVVIASLLILAFPWSPAFAAAPACASVFYLEGRLFETLAKVETIDMQVAAGIKKPTWHNFQAVNKLRSELQSFFKVKSSNKEAANFYKEMNQAWRTANRIDQIKKLQQSEPLKTYGPGEYGLILGYQEALQTLNDYLPSQMRFPKLKLTANQSPVQVNEDARTIVDALVHETDRFLKEQGYDSYENLRKELANSSHPAVSKSYQELEIGKMEFRMRRPESGRFWIEHSGFHNQHVTGSSKGFNNSVGRNAVEASMLNLTDYDHYASARNDLKPKYGSMQLDTNTDYTTNYGEDSYVFKKTISDRVTFTIGDSLNSMRETKRTQWRLGIAEGAKSWDQIFTPWSRRAVMAPFLPRSADDKIEFDAIDSSIQLARSHRTYGYIELQYWGVLTLDDVQAFVFDKEPPTGSFLKALKDRNILIYDHRDPNIPRKLWRPEK